MNVPKLRFSGFNNSYITEKLNKLVAIYDGTHETPNYTSSGVKFVSVENINNLLHSDKYISLKDFDKYKIKPKYNDVFMTRIGDIGTSAIYKSNDNLAYYVSLALLRTKNQLILNPDYLNQYIKSSNFQKELYKRTIHVAFPKKINTGEIGECDITIPEYIEQKRISKFLSILDKKIELQSKKVEALKLFKKGLNQKMFSESGEMRCIGEYIEEYTNKTTINNQYPILSSTFNGMMIQNEYFNKQAASLNNVGYKILPRNYITYRSMSDTGEFRFNIQNIIDVGIVSPAYPVFKVNNINSYYFLNYINESCEFKTQIISIKEGGTRFALNFNKFKNLKIKIIDNIETYGNLIRCLNIYFLRENEKLIYLNKLKKGFIQNMFI